MGPQSIEQQLRKMFLWLYGLVTSSPLFPDHEPLIWYTDWKQQYYVTFQSITYPNFMRRNAFICISDLCFLLHFMKFWSQWCNRCITLNKLLPDLILWLNQCNWKITKETQNSTHIFISGQIGGDQVCMEAREAQNGPDWEETYHKLHRSERYGQGTH